MDKTFILGNEDTEMNLAVCDTVIFNSREVVLEANDDTGYTRIYLDKFETNKLIKLLNEIKKELEW